MPDTLFPYTTLFRSEDMFYMRSTSADAGSMRMSVYFEIGTNPDQATINVNNRVQAALARLPEQVRQQGVTVQKRSSSILALVSLSSPDERYDRLFMSNYALLNVIDELKRIPGVGDASLFGAADYSMRIWLKPDKLAEFGQVGRDGAGVMRAQTPHTSEERRVGQECDSKCRYRWQP